MEKTEIDYDWKVYFKLLETNILFLNLNKTAIKELQLIFGTL